MAKKLRLASVPIKTFPRTVALLILVPSSYASVETASGVRLFSNIALYKSAIHSKSRISSANELKSARKWFEKRPVRATILRPRFETALAAGFGIQYGWKQFSAFHLFHPNDMVVVQ